MSEQIHIAFVKTLWGVTEQMGNGPSGYDSLFSRIKKDGFDAVETPISLVADKEKFAEAKPASPRGRFFSGAEEEWIEVHRDDDHGLSSKIEDHIVPFKRLIEHTESFL